MPTISEIEARLRDLTNKPPGHGQHDFTNVTAGLNRSEITNLLREWLILKGVGMTKAYSASEAVLNRAYGVGDRYINAIINNKNDNPELAPRYKNRTGNRRGFELELPPEQFDAKIVDLLNDVETPRETPETPHEIKVGSQMLRLDGEQVLNAAEKIINPKFDRTVRDLTDRFDTATRLVDNKITIGISQLGKDIAETVSNAIEAKGLGTNLTEQIRNLVDQQAMIIINKMVPRKLEIKVGNIVRNLDAEPRHKKFDEILMWLMSGSHVYIVGPKGTGKTHLGRQLATALGLDFYPIDQSLTKYDVKGYKGPTGEYIATLVRTCVEHGGLLFIDEGDMWASAALGSLNSILANDFGAFPDGVVKVHSDFICVICANTYGHGADRQYNGRNPLDAASLDRFSFVEVDYDEDLEIQLYGNGPWVQYVHRVRTACRALKYDDMVPSMRAISEGLKGLNAGLEMPTVAYGRLWKGAAQDKVNKIISQAGDLPQPNNNIVEIKPEPTGKVKELRDLVIGNLITAAIGLYQEIISDNGGFVAAAEARHAVEQYRDGLITIEQALELYA